MGTGLSGIAGTQVTSATVLNDGSIAVVGSFSTISGIAGPRGIAIWNGSNWVYGDILLNSVQFSAVLMLPDTTLIVGTNSAVVTTSSVVTLLTNIGQVKTYPRIILIGPGTVFSINNFITGTAVYFNLTLNAGEIAVIDFTNPQSVTFGSNFRPNLLGTILPGSNLDLFLKSGVNYLSLFIAGTVNANTAASIMWRNTFHSTDGALNLSLVN